MITLIFEIVCFLKLCLIYVVLWWSELKWGHAIDFWTHQWLELQSWRQVNRSRSKWLSLHMINVRFTHNYNCNPDLIRTIQSRKKRLIKSVWILVIEQWIQFVISKTISPFLFRLETEWDHFCSSLGYVQDNLAAYE